MRRGEDSDGRLIPFIATAQWRTRSTFEEEMTMPTRKPNKKRGRASSRGKTPRARAVPSQRKKPSAQKQRTRIASSVRAIEKVHAKRAGAKSGQGTSTKARAGKQPVPRKAGTAIAHAVTTVRKALVGAVTGAVTGAVQGAMTAVTPAPSPAGTASPQTSGDETGGEPGR